MPHSWESGPPESKSESWNYERRTELLSISSAILQAQITGMQNCEAWEGNNPLDAIDAQACAVLAKKLIDAVDNIQPKL